MIDNNERVKRESGIYVLYTKNHFYIGLSKNLRKRKFQHLYLLDNNKHPNKKLQNIYNSDYKIKFKVLEVVPEEQLEEKEIWWFNFYIENYKDLKPLNIKNCGSKPVHSYETKLKISKTKVKNDENYNIYYKKQYNLININNEEFLGTGTLFDLSIIFNVPSVMLLHSKQCIEAFEEPVSLDDIDYMNDWNIPI